MGRTELHYAAMEGDLDRASALLQSDIDCRMIEVLLAAGADPDHQNRSGNSPRDTANRIGNYDVRRCFERA